MWSKTKKRLDDLLCDSLKGRVQYFVTKYRGSHDQRGRVCILVDDKEVLSMCDMKKDVEVYKKTEELKKDPSYIPRYNSEYSALWEAKEIIGQSLFDTNSFFQAMECYINSPIEESLKSENCIVLILALLDRRIGKRTLKMQKERMQEQKDIVRYFYHLRSEAEEQASGCV